MKKIRFNKVHAALALVVASMSSAHAALPAGMAGVATEVIADIGAAAALGATIAVVALGTSIAFDVAKKFIRKGAK